VFPGTDVKGEPGDLVGIAVVGVGTALGQVAFASDSRVPSDVGGVDICLEIRASVEES